MNKAEQVVKIAKAKGRPMLVWVGKKPLERVKAYPAQLVESFSATVRSERGAAGAKSKDMLASFDWSDWPEKFPRGGLLFHGDNKDVLAYLLANGFRGKVKLIYIDPPFDSGADYVRKVDLRGKQKTAKVEGKEYTLGEQIQYTDIWANDNYLQFMYERLMLLRELLHDEGSIVLHCDSRRAAQLRLLMDEVFGEENFQNELIWQRTNAHNMPTKTYVRAHDNLLFYSKTDKIVFNKQYQPYSEAQLRRYKRDENGRLYTGQDLTFSTVNAARQFEWRGTKPPGNRSWGYSKDDLERLWNEAKILAKRDGTPRLDGLKVYLDEAKGKPLTTIWTDISRVANTASERSDYPTQKPEELLRRLIAASSEPGALILDTFSGSGTTAAVAQKLGRRWIGCDINKGAIQTTAKRLQTIMAEQAEAARKPKQETLDESGEAGKPCQLSFTTWRVNDYDLQIQHNEAVELACEYLGVTRMRTDTYFDGTRGKNLVKIVPFNHPLTPLDIEDLNAELKRRPDEERGITLVCLGMELKAKEEIEKHNRNRPINRIHVIELRTDKTYGGFIRHEPLSADVLIKRKGDKLAIEIENVISPTVLQRLGMEEGIFRAEIPDWRAVVDCVLIDTDYDGEVFNVALADVPSKKSALVAGRYELPAPRKGATVAVKILDMLGEETLITKQT